MKAESEKAKDPQELIEALEYVLSLKLYSDMDEDIEKLLARWRSS
jgi:hypothetical protein